MCLCVGVSVDTIVVSVSNDFILLAKHSET